MKLSTASGRYPATRKSCTSISGGGRPDLIAFSLSRLLILLPSMLKITGRWAYRGVENPSAPLQRDVLGRVHQVLLPAEHMRDLHQLVVDDAGEVIGGESVALDDYEILMLLRGDCHRTEDVVNDGDVLVGHLQANDHRPPGRLGRQTLLNGGHGFGADITPHPLLSPGLLAHGRQFFRRLEGIIGLAGFEELTCVVLVGRQPLALEIGSIRSADLRSFVPQQPQPTEVVENLAHRVLDVAGLVGVFNAQDERPAVLAGEQPVEQHRPRPADVQVSRRRGGEPDAQKVGGFSRHAKPRLD